MKRGLLILTFVSVIVLGALHQIGSLFFLYWDIVWFDTFVHFLGGFAVALLFLWFWYRARALPSRSRAIFLALIFVAIVSAGWEVFEYIYDIANPTGGTYQVDTLTDLFADIVGGAIAAFVGTIKKFHV
ncbi:DUF2238 domain-containing protein [Candidatus Parcubacteria bacterium]|nr:DUF2238 domain-containing protein [Candidatus Parcubacteria bacterium]